MRNRMYAKIAVFVLLTSALWPLTSGLAVETGTGTNVVPNLAVQNTIVFGGTARTNWPTSGSGDWATQSATTNINANGFDIQNAHSFGFAMVTSDLPKVPSFYVKKAFIQTNQSDAVTVVLLHLDGTNGANAFLDSSPSNWPVVGHGAVKLSTNQARFGASSAYFDGNTTMQVMVPTNMSIGSRDFTMECFAMITNGGFGGIMGRTYFDGCLYYVAGVLYYRFDGLYELNYTTSLVNNAWYHFALVKTGTACRLFIDGKQVAGGPNSAPATMPLAVDNSFNLGARIVNTSTGLNSRCYIDEVRWTIGAGRYTNDFTPPTGPFDITISTNEGLYYFDGTTEKKVQLLDP
jgi:hypothetical protein